MNGIIGISHLLLEINRITVASDSDEGPDADMRLADLRVRTIEETISGQAAQIILYGPAMVS